MNKHGPCAVSSDAVVIYIIAPFCCCLPYFLFGTPAWKRESVV